MKRYIKSSSALPLENECDPVWYFTIADSKWTFKSIIEALSERLEKLPFVLDVKGAGMSFERPNEFALELEVYMNKDALDLTDVEIDAIEDCGVELGCVDFEI